MSTRSTKDSKKTSSSNSSRDPSPSPLHGSSNPVESHPPLNSQTQHVPASSYPVASSSSSSNQFHSGSSNQMDSNQLAMLQLVQSLTNQVNSISMNQVSAQPSVVSQNSNFHKLQLFYADTRTIETVKCPKLEKMDPISVIEWKNQVEQWAIGKMVWDLIIDDNQVTERKAIDFCTGMNLSEAKIKTALINLQTVVWTALLEAVAPVLGTTIGSSIKHEQNQAITQGRNVFLYRNPNYLWSDLEKRFGRKAGVGTVQ